MSWHNGSLSTRASVAVWTASNAASTYDVTVAPSSDFEEFWSTVLSTGYDVRFYSADGTALAFARSSWTHASRTASFRVTGVVTTATNQIVQIFMYWGGSLTDGATSPAVGSGPLTSVELFAAPPARVVTARAQAPGATVPAETVTKASGETVWVWWDAASLLLERETRYNGFLSYEEIKTVNSVTVYSNGASQGSMTTQASTKIRAGRHIVTQHSGGTTATDYVIVLNFTTTLSRVIDARVKLAVEDVTEG